MPPDLANRLAEIRRRVRQTLIAYGLSWFALVVIGSMLLACLADWAFHLDDAGVRVILELAILGSGAWVAYRCLVEPLRVPLSNVDLALRIEDRYPGFHDSLASSVQFLESESDPRVGSPALQQAVVRQTLSRLAHLDGSDVVRTQIVRRIAIAAISVCLTAAFLTALDHSRAAIALRRLLLPLSAPAWPRLTNLQLLTAELVPLDDSESPLLVARGDMLKLFAENETGRLPDKVTLEYQGDDGKTVSELMRPLTRNGQDGKPRELAVGQVPAVKGDIRFRAVGGDDDDMPWHRLRVVPPPVVERLQVAVTPPAYSKNPVEELPEGVGHVQGLVGARVTISATASKPLGRAAIVVHDQRQNTVQLSPDSRQLTASFLIAEPGLHSWWLELEDADGFTDAEPPRYELKGVLDAEPEIRIDLPAADMQVTPDAQVPLKTVARDDLGLRAIRLVHRREDNESMPPVSIPLFDGTERPREQTVDYIWKLAELGLTSGSRVIFHTEATDDYDLTEVLPAAPPPHVGRSVSRVLSVVTKEEKIQELVQRQAGLLDDLERAFKLQQRVREQVGELQTQIQTAREMRPADVDSLQRAEISQREVAGQLAHPANGVQRRAREMLQELRGNQLDDPQSERRLNEIIAELERLGDDNLPIIEQELTRARKQLLSARNQPSDRASSEDRPEKSLKQVADNQDAVLDSLSEMLQELSQWRTEQDAHRDLAELIQQQRELNRKTGELGKQTLTKPRDSLAPQDQADLAKLAEQQKKQAERLDQVGSRIQERVEQLSKSNPDVAEHLKDVLDQARRQGVSDQMLEAAAQITENRMGEASRSQREVLEKLRELAGGLNEERESDTETLVKKLKQAEQDLQSLRDREQELLRKVEQAQQLSDPAQRQAQLEQLRKEQQELREETSRMARRLERLFARRSSEAAQRAAGRMKQAQNDFDQGEQAEAGRQQQEALDDLEQAQRELARERRRAEEQLAREQLEKIATELAAMTDRQQAVLEETRRLDTQRQETGKLSRSQLVSLRNLTNVQRDLKHDTDRLAETLSAAEVFAQALRGAARNMQRAIDLLEERDTAGETQFAQENAHRRFVDLNDALKQDENDGGDKEQKPPEAGDGGSGEGSGPETDGIPAIAQLKMLLSLQREILERTAHLSELRKSGAALTATQQEEFEALAREQGELADLARNLSRLASEPADEPEPQTGAQDEAADKPAEDSKP